MPPKSWIQCKLGEYAEITMGQSPESTHYSSNPEDVPFLQGNRTFGSKYPHFDTYTSKVTKLAVKNSVLLSVRAPVGDVNIAPNDVCLGRGVSGLTSIDVTNEFLYYLLRNLTPVLNQNENGSTFGSINKSDLESLPILLPDITTRDKIATILSTIDSKIEINREINANLLNSLRSIIDHYFCYLPEDMPEGWMSCSLPDIANIISGYSYKGNELVENSNDALVTIKNFNRTGGFKIGGYKPLSISNRVKDTQYVELFDIVIAHTDLTQGAEIIGNSEIILSKGGFDKLVASMDLVKIDPNNTIGRFLLAALLSNYQFKGHCLGYVNGTTVLHLSKDAVKEYSLTIPKDASIIEKYDMYCEYTYRMIAHNMKENEKLTALRDYLLPRLMSGEIDVSQLDLDC